MRATMTGVSLYLFVYLARNPLNDVLPREQTQHYYFQRRCGHAGDRSRLSACRRFRPRATWRALALPFACLFSFHWLIGTASSTRCTMCVMRNAFSVNLIIATKICLFGIQFESKWVSGLTLGGCSRTMSSIIIYFTHFICRTMTGAVLFNGRIAMKVNAIYTDRNIKKGARYLK